MHATCDLLIEKLTRLRDSFAPIDPRYAERSHEIALNELRKLYFSGDIESLSTAEESVENDDHKYVCRALIQRLRYRSHALGALREKGYSRPVKEKLLLQLRDSYYPNEQGYAEAQNRLNRFELKQQVAALDATDLSNNSYYTQHIELNNRLIHTYPKHSEKIIELIQEIRLLEDLQVYTEKRNTLISSEGTSDIVSLHAHFVQLLADTRTINAAYGQQIATDWIEERIHIYDQYMTFYRAIDELQAEEQAKSDTRQEQVALLQEILSLAALDDATRETYREKLETCQNSLERDRLIASIETTPDLDIKIRLIRDDLLIRTDIDANERIAWENKLSGYLIERAAKQKVEQKEALLNELTAKIRALRAELAQATPNQQIALQNEYAELLKQRASLMQQQ